ncbi:MAG: DUF58 domain-containing protein [Chloroflexota bacterium]|nr:DUF58 domain-containing protein [Chloroflexota bacterium]
MVLRSRLLPFLVVLLLAVQLVVPWRGWAMALAGLGGAWALSWLWARSLLHGLELKREMRFGWAQVGDRLEERFTLINRGWAPALWVEVLDHSDMPDYDVSRATGVGATSQHRWRTGGVCSQRGLFTLGPTTISTGDPLGLYTVNLLNAASATLMVTPPILPLPSIEVAPGGRVGDGRPRPYTLERTITSSTVREYVPGDERHWIHWPTTSRRGSLHVRLFDGAPVGDWWIFLDMARDVQVGEGWASTEEHGVMLAASLADRGLRAGRNVGLVAHGVEPLWLPPRADPDQRLKILRSLALLSTGDLRLEGLLERSRATLGRYASVVLITPDIDGSWIERLLLMQRRGVVPTVLLLDPRSFGGDSSAHPMMASLSEHGITHHLITPDLLDRPEATPGQRGAWEWKVLGTGRVIATQAPSDRSWRELG